MYLCCVGYVAVMFINLTSFNVVVLKLEFIFLLKYLVPIL